MRNTRFIIAGIIVAVIGLSMLVVPVVKPSGLLQVTYTTAVTSSSFRTMTMQEVLDPLDDSSGPYDISKIVFEKRGDVLSVYTVFSHGDLSVIPQTSIVFIVTMKKLPLQDAYWVVLRPWPSLSPSGWRCALQHYPPGSDFRDSETELDCDVSGDTWIAYVPMSLIGGQLEFYGSAMVMVARSDVLGAMVPEDILDYVKANYVNLSDLRYAKEKTITTETTMTEIVTTPFEGTPMTNVPREALYIVFIAAGVLLAVGILDRRRGIRTSDTDQRDNRSRQWT